MMKEKILALRSLGWSYKQIVKELGCSSGTVAYHCGIGQKEKTRQRSRLWRRGEKSHRVLKSRCDCGNKKSRQAKTCHTCKVKVGFEAQMNRTLEDVKSYGNARTKWAHLRKLAHRNMALLGVEKKCDVCGFDVVVDLCHIKPINDFRPASLVSEVNARENLVYLCPNHHAMLDRGLLRLQAPVE